MLLRSRHRSARQRVAGVDVAGILLSDLRRLLLQQAPTRLRIEPLADATGYRPQSPERAEPADHYNPAKLKALAGLFKLPNNVPPNDPRPESCWLLTACCPSEALASALYCPVAAFAALVPPVR